VFLLFSYRRNQLEQAARILFNLQKCKSRGSCWLVHSDFEWNTKRCTGKNKKAEAEYDTLTQKANEKLLEVGRIDRRIERK